MLAPLDNLAENRLVDVGDRNRLGRNGIVAEILDKVADEHRPLGNDTVDGQNRLIIALGLTCWVALESDMHD